MNWTIGGFVIGVLVGGLVGVLVTALLRAAAEADEKMATARGENLQVDLELLVVPVLRELAGEASMCWSPRPSSQVFESALAAAAAERAASRVAELVRARLDAMDAEVTDLVFIRHELEGDLRTEVRRVRERNDRIEKLAARVEHLAWAGGMVLGIAEGVEGWESVKEYPAGSPKAEGMPAIRAVKKLRRAYEDERGTREGLEAFIGSSATAGGARRPA